MRNVEFVDELIGWQNTVKSIFETERTENHIRTQLKLNFLASSSSYSNRLYFIADTGGSVFPWHVEDANFYSISYLHEGHPKVWYALPPEQGPEFEKFMEKSYPTSFRKCAQFIQHKQCVTDPNILRNENIRVTKVSKGFQVGFY